MYARAEAQEPVEVLRGAHRLEVGIALERIGLVVSLEPVRCRARAAGEMLGGVVISANRVAIAGGEGPGFKARDHGSNRIVHCSLRV
jgi:hypothetical protein